MHLRCARHQYITNFLESLKTTPKCQLLLHFKVLKSSTLFGILHTSSLVHCLVKFYVCFTSHSSMEINLNSAVTLRRYVGYSFHRSSRDDKKYIPQHHLPLKLILCGQSLDKIIWIKIKCM